MEPRVPPMKLTLVVNKGTPYPQMFLFDPKPPGPPQDTYGCGTYNYQRNKEVTITAPANITVRRRVWIFDHWAGDARGDSREIKITMDTDKTIVACYTELASLPIPFKPPIKPPPYEPGPPTPIGP